MAVLSERKRVIVESVIQAAPDSAIRSLELALSADGAGTGIMSGVRAIVETEAMDRALRNQVLAPVAPLCGRREPGALSFPIAALGRMWKGLRTAYPDLVRAAGAAGWNREDRAPKVFDDLCELAAAGLRQQHPAFAGIGAADAQGLAACLDLAPLTRSLAARMQAWTVNMTGERAAVARLAYKDAGAMADDAGPRFFEMLSAQLDQPWLILRVISAVMDRPAERYLASSELSRFGDRAVANIDRLIEQIKGFDPLTGQGDGQDEAAGLAAGRSVETALTAISEFEESIQLGREGVWGKAMTAHKQTLAKLVEVRLSSLDRLVGLALPLEKPKFGSKGRGAPRLDIDPDAAAITRAAGGLAFADAVRLASANGGFGSVRAAAVEKVNDRLDHYTDELLADLRDGESQHPERTRAFLDAAARLVAFAQDDKAAQIIRRRAAAA